MNLFVKVFLASLVTVFIGVPAYSTLNAEPKALAPAPVVDTYNYVLVRNVPTSGNIFSNFTVPQFGSDSTHAGKTLLSTYITVDYAVARDIDWEYLNSSSSGGVTIWSRDMKLFLEHTATNTEVDNFNDVSAVNGLLSSWVATGPYDGTIDYSGTSGGNIVVYNGTHTGPTRKYNVGTTIGDSHIGHGTVEYRVHNQLAALSYYSGESFLLTKNNRS